MRVVYPPQVLSLDDWYPNQNIFLAGSIEMNTAEDWQSYVIEKLKYENITFLNPRRADWDNTISQSEDDPRFVEQVEWELNMLENSDIIAMFLQPGTISPISLLELGLHAPEGKMIVCCPDGFHRKGNVTIVCRRFGVEMVDTLDQLIGKIKELV